MTVPVISLLCKRFLTEAPTNLPVEKIFAGLLKAEVARIMTLNPKERYAALLEIGLTDSRDLAVHVVAWAVRTKYVSRSMQVLLAVRTALTVDGPLKETDLPWKILFELVLVYAGYDLQGLLLGWIKQNSAYCACLCAQQQETNLESLNKILGSISASGLPTFTPGCFGPGILRRVGSFLMAPRKGMNAFGRRVLRMGENVLYIKRACPPMLSRDVDSQLSKHKERVCRPVQFGPRTLRETETRTRIKAAIYEVVHKVFGGTVFEPTECFPSLNSCYTNGRFGGGALGELLTATHDVTDTLPTSAFLGLPMLDSMVETRAGHVNECRILTSRLARLESFSSKVSAEFVGSRPVKTRIIASQDGFSFAETSRTTRPIEAKVFPILEPCKLRPISIGEAAPYHRLFSVQQFLWGEVKKQEVFTYTSRPIADDWDRAVPPSELHSRFGDLEDVSFGSGDFDAATDNMDPEFSEYTWDVIANFVSVRDERGLTPLKLTLWYDLVRQGLTGHKLSYPDRTKLMQTWGQLMGSPVSFPILNIINAATTATAFLESYLLRHNTVLPEFVDWEELQHRYTLAVLEFFFVHTNGDDIFFVCPDGHYEEWKYVTTCAGLVPSVGKNYRSKYFCVMNSELRMLVRESVPWTLPPHPFTTILRRGERIAFFTADNAPYVPSGIDLIAENRRFKDQLERFESIYGFDQVYPDEDSGDLPEGIPHGAYMVQDYLMLRDRFLHGGSTVTEHWEYQSFANLPVLFGLSAKGLEAGQSKLPTMTWWELSSLARAAVRGIPKTDPRFGSRLRVFEAAHATVLQRVPPGVDKYFPQDLGGVGIPDWGNPDHVTPTLPRLRAAWLACMTPVERCSRVIAKSADYGTVWEEIVGKALVPDYVSLSTRRQTDAILQAEECATRRGSRVTSDVLAKAIEEATSLLDSFCMETLFSTGEPSPYRKNSFQLGRLTTLGMRQFAHWWHDTSVSADTILTKDISRRERTYTKELRRQFRSCKATSLHPISLETVRNWSDPDVLVYCAAGARIKARVTLA